MDKEQQRIAISEWCGWRRESGINPWTEEMCHWFSPDNKGFKTPPDYLNDLNAMHEAEEKLLTGGGWRERLAEYSSKLMLMHDTNFGKIDVAYMVHLRYFTLHSTAAQRAEALLRTIGKWT